MSHCSKCYETVNKCQRAGDSTLQCQYILTDPSALRLAKDFLTHTQQASAFILRCTDSAHEVEMNTCAIQSTFRAAMQAAADDDEATLVAEIGELDDPLGRR